MKTRSIKIALVLLGLVRVAHAQSDSLTGEPATPAATPAAVQLIPALETMATAWDFPRNPMVDSLPADPHVAAQIKRGFRIFTETPSEAANISGNKVACNNCHLNGGQKEHSMTLVGISGMFPEYNKRAGRLISLEDRIVECFLRSSNAAGKKGIAASSPNSEFLSAHSPEVLAVSAYITWLSADARVGTNPPWRGRNVIPEENRIPVGKLSARRGEFLYLEKCVTCHGKDGEGVEIGDKKAGPLWGPNSWNDGAGAARIYTLAGIIRYMMPYLDPGSLTDEEAQQIAAFINTKPRPKYPFKNLDYQKEKLPPDAVYYKK